MEQTLLVVTTLAVGLIGGLWFAFVVAVMPALGRQGDRTFVDVMNEINRVILNPVFLLTYVGALVLCLVTTVLLWDHDDLRVLLLVADLGYAVTFVGTAAANVPLNNQLAETTPDAGDEAMRSARTAFEVSWNRWHLVRTLATAASFVCLCLALAELNG